MAVLIELVFDRIQIENNDMIFKIAIAGFQ